MGYCTRSYLDPQFKTSITSVDEQKSIVGIHSPSIYHIEVKTADKLFAGTDDNVEIKFSGTKNGIVMNSRQSYESI